MQAKITALGTYVPERIVDNHYFESIVETNDEWIISRTGIRTRHFAAENEYTSHLCAGAAKSLVEENNVTLDDVDFVVVATVTPDQTMPSVATQVQDKLGLTHAGAIDISAACAGFAYGIILAQGLIAAGTHRKVLVFGAETLTKFTNYEDRSSCVLFGDGAGAVLLEAAPKGNILAAVTGSQGDGGKDLYLSNLRKQINGQDVITDNKIHQNGRAVFKWAVNTVTEQMSVLAERSRMKLQDIDWFVPHSANMRIIEALCNQSGFPLEKTLESISIYGNTSSASIPLALHRGLREGKVKKGDRLLMIGFGGGLVYAGLVVEWGNP
ncbi:MAG: ketoacyl-ACP synthase III [Saprospirales bacterium]|nr:ketoacyl-ACP synthase III [Saprospirales bacterium]MBK8920515.1 ketoacyl-ACP synthase III [Saprospirales bacterium]